MVSFYGAPRTMSDSALNKGSEFQSETIPMSRPDTVAALPDVRRRPLVASFDGTFAPEARPPFEPSKHVPWYRDREYYVGGWPNPTLWRSAASIISTDDPGYSLG